MTSLKKDNGETRCLFYLRIWRRITMFTRDFFKVQKSSPMNEYMHPLLRSSWEAHCTVNIFGSKSGHLNNSRNCKVFFIFSTFLLYLMIFLSSAAHLALSILKNHQILQKVWRKWRKIFQLFYYLNGRFWNQKCSQWC